MAVREKDEIGTDEESLGSAPLFFLEDFGQWLWEVAEKARQERNRTSAENATGRGFAEGEAQAYYYVLLHFMNELAAFGIDPQEVGLGHIDPDRLLK